MSSICYLQQISDQVSKHLACVKQAFDIYTVWCYNNIRETDPENEKTVNNMAYGYITKSNDRKRRYRKYPQVHRFCAWSERYRAHRKCFHVCKVTVP